jgi:DNA-binding NtrC family response regulator
MGPLAEVQLREACVPRRFPEERKEYIFEMLRRTSGNKKRAAEMLGLDRKTLYRKLEEYGADGYWPEL